MRSCVRQNDFSALCINLIDPVSRGEYNSSNVRGAGPDIFVNKKYYQKFRVIEYFAMELQIYSFNMSQSFGAN